MVGKGSPGNISGCPPVGANFKAKRRRQARLDRRMGNSYYSRVLPRNKRFLMATSLKINDALKSRVDQLASQRRRSPHWIMLEAIQQYVEREEARESFRQDALRAWEQYQATGQHLTMEEADTWLAKLEAGEDAEIPPCHA